MGLRNLVCLVFIATLLIGYEGEAPTVATIQFMPSSLHVKENDGSVTVNLLRTGNYSDNFTVYINIEINIEPAIATPAINLTKLIVNISPSDESVIPLVFNLQDDDVHEPVDAYRLTIVNVSDPNVTVGDTSVTYIYVDDDDHVLGGVVIEFKDSAYSVVEGVRFYNVTLVRQGEPEENIAVSIHPSPDSTAVDTVEFPFDYNQGGQVTFTPGGPNETTTQLHVQDDSTLEANETLLLTISLTPTARERGGRIGARDQSRVTIIDDDMVQVMFQQQHVETNKSTGQARFSVTFTPLNTEIPFTFIVETFDLLPSDARADIDYQPLRRNVTLSKLHNTEHLAVDIIQDDITKGNKTFGVRISIPAETQKLGVLLGTQSELIISIIDDDSRELEITVFTNTTGDGLGGYVIQLCFNASQDDVTYRCRMNDLPFIPCTNPHIFMNANISQSETVTVMVEGRIAIAFPVETATVTKSVFIAMGGLQVVSAGAMAVQLQATKNATYKCRLNDYGEFIDCFDGQVFQFLTAGIYTLFIEATSTENMSEVAYNKFGPVLLTVGINANISETTAACFGRQQIRCNHATSQDCQYVATWRTRGHRVEFILAAQTQGWVGIGFSTDRKMPRSDVIVGAANNATFFVDDRYTENRIQPPKDAVQDIDNAFASFVNGVTTVQFSRNKTTSDPNKDLSLHTCRFLLFAWSGNANHAVIQFHGSQNRAISDTLICFPSPSLCPERFDCGEPGALDNGTRNFTDTLEGGVVTYSCDTGFAVVGNHTQTCQITSDGAFWSFTRPHCMPVATSSDHDTVSAAVISGAVVGTTLLIIAVVIAVVIMAVILSRRRKKYKMMPDETKLFNVPNSQQRAGQTCETKLYVSTSRKKSEYHDHESTQREVVESTSSFGGTIHDEVTDSATMLT